MNRRLVSWLMAGAGAALALCAVLVSVHLTDVFAGRGQAAAAVVAPRQVTASGRPSGIIAQTQTADGDTISLTATPDQFGMYTFLVAVRDAQGAPLRGAAVDMVLTMPDMQMDAMRIHAPPIVPPVPGAYQAQGVLAVGRWQAVVQVLAQGAMRPAQAVFRFSVA